MSYLGNVTLADAEVTDQLRITNYGTDWATSGVRVVNNPRGRFQAYTGEESITVECSYCNPNSQLVVNQELPDNFGDGFLVSAVTPGDGEFTVYFAAPCNADGYIFSFIVVN